MPETIIVRDRVYLPARSLCLDSVKEAYTKNMYENAACRKCENYQERHNYLCDTCEAYLGTYKLFRMVERNGKMYIGLPIGDKKNIERKTGVLLSEYKVVDKRVQPKFDYPVKFTLELREHQQVLAEVFLKHSNRYGLIEAPPRTGKTALLLYIAIKLGLRVLILANQHEFLEQFLDHIHGNPKEGIPKCTNLPELEKKYKKKLYGFPKTEEDYNTFQIMVCTYQQFISAKNGKARFKKLFPNVGTVGVDEVHRMNADGFSKVVQRFPSRYKLGVTGTVDRKDGKQFISKHIIGPIVARTTVEALTPTVYIHETDVEGRVYKSGKRSWVFAMQYLSNHEKRNEQIVQQAVRDIKNGHNIVIPVAFKKHVFELQRRINQEYGKHICGTFVGGGTAKNKNDRKELLSQAKAGKIKCIVGIRSLLQLGLNVPTWSCIYTVVPISNEPNYKQETKRVCTPLDGKRSPIIRLFVDFNQGQSIGCARNCVKQMKKFGYDFAKSERQRKLLYKILSSGKASEVEEFAADADFKPTKITWDKPSRPVVKRF